MIYRLSSHLLHTYLLLFHIPKYSEPTRRRIMSHWTILGLCVSVGQGGAGGNGWQEGEPGATAGEKGGGEGGWARVVWNLFWGFAGALLSGPCVGWKKKSSNFFSLLEPPFTLFGRGGRSFLGDFWVPLGRGGNPKSFDGGGFFVLLGAFWRLLGCRGLFWGLSVFCGVF